MPVQNNNNHFFCLHIVTQHFSQQFQGIKIYLIEVCKLVTVQVCDSVNLSNGKHVCDSFFSQLDISGLVGIFGAV